MFQCKDLMALPSLAKAKIISGESGLTNGIRWVYKPEDMNFAKWVRGNELLIISTPVIQSKDFDLYQLVTKAIQLKMAGALLLVGNQYIANISRDVITYSNENNFPIFAISGNMPLVDIFEEVGHAIAYDDKANSASDDMLSRIIFGNEIHIDAFKLQCVENGYDVAPPQQIFMIHTHSSEMLQSFDYETVRMKIKKCFDEENVPVLLSRYGNNFIGCFRTTQETKRKLTAIYEKLKEFVSDNYSGWELSMGIGRDYEQLKDLQKSFNEASRCIVLAEKINYNKDLIWHKEIGFYNLLLEFEEKERIEEFIQDTLGAILEYDEENHTDFLYTLKVYLWSNRSFLHASEKLHMHKNTVKYRVQRMEELTGKDFEDPTARLEFMNAILCKEIYR